MCVCVSIWIVHLCNVLSVFVFGCAIVYFNFWDAAIAALTEATIFTSVRCFELLRKNKITNEKLKFFRVLLLNLQKEIRLEESVQVHETKKISSTADLFTHTFKGCFKKHILSFELMQL